jgi:hypothetical protein
MLDLGNGLAACLRGVVTHAHHHNHADEWSFDVEFSNGFKKCGVPRSELRLAAKHVEGALVGRWGRVYVWYTLGPT